MTLRAVFNSDVAAIAGRENINDQVRHPVRLMPVLRLRDARFMRRIRNGMVPNVPDAEVTARQLDFLARELATRPQNSNRRADRQDRAMVQLLEHYFSEQGAGLRASPLMRRAFAKMSSVAGAIRDIINRMIDKTGQPVASRSLLGLFSTLLQAKGTLLQRRTTITAGGRSGNPFTSHYAFSRPAIAQSVGRYSDSDNQLRRIALAANAGGVTCRTAGAHLSRVAARVWAWRVKRVEDGRRIAFHIRFNRASSLFARCWLLVKRETETSLLMSWRVSVTSF